MNIMMARFLFVIALCFVVALAPACATNLGGTASVSVTSDTAVTAKTMAMDEARRQILAETLAQYALPDQLTPALATADTNALTNMIASTAISGEKLSDTTYSADISMTVSMDAARAWMTENNIQNWLPDGVSTDMFVVLITLSDKMADWMEINRIARAENIELNVKYIMNNQITAEMPAASRAAFTIAAREAGWQYADMDGALRVWRR